MIQLESNTTFLYVAEEPLMELQIRSLNRASRGLSSTKKGAGTVRAADANIILIHSLKPSGPNVT